MDKKEYEILRSKFLKILAKIPHKIRSEEVIVIVDDGPYTWNNAAIEIKNNTEIGRKIIKTLKEMEIL